MRKRIILINVFALAIVIYLARINYLYNNSYAPKKLSYKMQENVQIESDYFNNSSEKMNGYSITVLNTELVSVEEFKRKYSNYTNRMNAEYVYLITACFKNENNQDGDAAGIDLAHYILQEKSYINFLDREAYALVNGFDTIKFSLRVNTEYEIIIPFHIDLDYINVKRLRTGSPKLILSLYPHKKMIDLLK
jgi:hypothetical protein